MSWLSWDNAAEIFLAYLAIGIIIYAVFAMAVGSESTTQGRMIGHFLGFWTGLLWPLAVPAWLIMFMAAVVRKLWWLR